MNELEYINVKHVYDQIAHSFDYTRDKRIWSNVEKFLNENVIQWMNVPMKILDYGCGNGKYIPLINLDLHEYHAFDNCKEFINMINTRYPKVKTMSGDVCLNNNYKNEYFDIIISIAVIHHLTTFERRVEMIYQMMKMLKSGAKCLITAWTMEERFGEGEGEAEDEAKLDYDISKNKIFKKSCKINDSSSSSDYLIPFLHENVNYNRFYHLFKYNDFLDLVKEVEKKLNKKIKIHDYYYESNNYCLIISHH